MRATVQDGRSDVNLWGLSQEHVREYLPVLFSQSQTWNESLKQPENHPLFLSATNTNTFQFFKITTNYTNINQEQNGSDTQF